MYFCTEIQFRQTMKYKILLLFPLFLLISTHAVAGLWLFKDRKSDYVIVLPEDASVSERIAANELSDMLTRISGATLKVTQTPASKNIFVGWTAATGVIRPQAEDESYTYKTIGSNLHIYGGSNRGTMYGVYAFLERELGVRWLTSEVTHMPKVRQYELPQLNHSEHPAIRQRLDFCYDALKHDEWVVHNLLNAQYPHSKTLYGNMDTYWGIHTFKVLIPPEKYFKSHPEYFSLYKGARSDKAQLCLSNAEMRRELIKNLKEIISTRPGYWCYDVSQNDNSFPCECRSCKQLVKKYGGESGAIIWFVNQVAGEIKQDYPDKLIGTFAYRYTRHAPQSRIKPADNVVIRLCDIECCMAHGLEQCEQNQSFLDDLKDWQKKTRNIYIWDYTTGFLNYLLPFPNFDVLAENFRLFSRSNVIGVMEEGAHNAPWAEFSELKQWLIANLLWNPYQNVDSLASIFINDYYGAAAPHVRRYYNLCKQQIGRDVHFTVRIDWNNGIYTDKFTTDATIIIQQALAAVRKDSDEYKRVQRIAAQIYYLRLRKNGLQAVTDGTLQKLKDVVAKDNTIIAEIGMTLEELLKKLKYR